VIGTNKGLLGELIIQNNLGHTINDIKELSDKIIVVVNDNPMPIGSPIFVVARSVANFAQRILNTI
jgi:deoxyxylulose-5-phosphate synthase